MKRVPNRELLDDDAGTAAGVSKLVRGSSLFQSLFWRRSDHDAHGWTGSADKREIWLLGAGGGSGSGDLPQSVRTCLQQSGVSLQLTLLDRCSSHLVNGETKVGGNTLALPFRDGSFDLISCCLFVHHLQTKVTVFVKEALRCSRVELRAVLQRCFGHGDYLQRRRWIFFFAPRQGRQHPNPES
jgi:SAM-dependent methyltransferase